MAVEWASTSESLARTAEFLKPFYKKSEPLKLDPTRREQLLETAAREVAQRKINLAESVRNGTLSRNTAERRFEKFQDERTGLGEWLDRADGTSLPPKWINPRNLQEGLQSALNNHIQLPGPMLDLLSEHPYELISKRAKAVETVIFDASALSEEPDISHLPPAA